MAMQDEKLNLVLLKADLHLHNFCLKLSHVACSQPEISFERNFPLFFPIFHFKFSGGVCWAGYVACNLLTTWVFFVCFFNNLTINKIEGQDNGTEVPN
jgi:hypothetical protein